jgi:hypothetical protein
VPVELLAWQFGASLARRKLKAARFHAARADDLNSIKEKTDEIHD